jgi:hypothetical protein
VRVGEIIGNLRAEVLRLIRDARGISRDDLIARTGAEAARVDYVLKMLRKGKVIASLRRGQQSLWIDVERSLSLYSELSHERRMAERRRDANRFSQPRDYTPDPIHQCPSVWHYASRLAA